MLTAVQGVLDEAGLAPEVFVKYSYIGARDVIGPVVWAVVGRVGLEPTIVGL